MPGLVTGRAVFIFMLGIMSLIVAMALNSGCIQAGSGTGTLTGNVSIGPLCPVEPCTVSHDRLVAAYEARPITISTTAGSVVTTVIADPETGYPVVLKPGTYMVDIPHQGSWREPGTSADRDYPERRRQSDSISPSIPGSGNRYRIITGHRKKTEGT